jgi:hypothetical protein
VRWTRAEHAAHVIPVTGMRRVSMVVCIPARTRSGEADQEDAVT